jgi:hypothetical protein
VERLQQAVPLVLQVARRPLAPLGPEARLPVQAAALVAEKLLE